jgi:uncharacterized membrane protein YphA (DoxX/SURF4 family)
MKERFMASDTKPAVASKVLFWIGWVLTVLPVPLLVMSAVMKFVKSPDVVEGFKHLEWPENLALALGIVELACTILYVIPRTAVLGAILFTGYMGGAIATHMRIGEPFYVQALLGVVVWLGLYLRDARLRALLPLRR